MRKIYSYFYLMSVVFVISIVLTSCSKNHEDIAAPSILYTYPAQGDTIQVINDYITIFARAKDDVPIDEMNMKVQCESGYFYYDSDYEKGSINDQDYTCYEKFYVPGITELTRMKLTFYFENNFKNFNEEEIGFYVKP
jgi:hypothetical protein